MEHGFYHPDIGYWQTNSDVTQDILDGYPAGTVEIPLRPMGRVDWDGAKWIALPPDLEALAAEARFHRNGLLAASDWTQMPDAPVNQTAWAVYRQALRDVTAQGGFPTNISWPVAPE